MDQLDMLIKQYLDINSKIRILEEEKNSIKAEIKLNLKTFCIDKYKSPQGDFISYSEQIRKVLDKDKVKDIISDEDKFQLCFKETKFELLKILDKETYEKIKTFTKK